MELPPSVCDNTDVKNFARKNEIFYGAQCVVLSSHSCHSFLEVVLFWEKFNA